MHLFNGPEFDEVLDLVMLVMAILVVAELLGLLDGPSEVRGRYVPAEAINQADRGREVQLPRAYGPDLYLVADVDEADGSRFSPIGSDS